MANFDIYAAITDRIIAELENGIIPWRKPWTGTTTGAISRETGRPYSLLNQMLLGTPGEYLTWNQVKKEGGSVKKGAKAKMVVFWKVYPREKKNADGQTVTDTEGKPVMEGLPVLRYFNVFGQRQDPYGAYAAVIPQWFAALTKGDTVYVNGDGETSRDFCYIDNVVQANLLASYAADDARNLVCNVAFGQRTTLNELFGLIRDEVVRHKPEAAEAKPAYRDFRAGDVRHSLADITRARTLLGYEPEYDVRQGLRLAGDWYDAHL